MLTFLTFIQLSVISYQLSVISYQLSLFIVHCSLFTVHCSLFTVLIVQCNSYDFSFSISSGTLV
ncbi:hypothetical protein DP117_10470 [Brasilonema sp. UFV-L1]|nr:hypothetical protein [Brasilonema sp. UFV-L1]